MKRERILIIILFALLPLLTAAAYCGASGKGIWDIFIPNSYWNDELFYYKQVEGILERGVPAGYFGFNESHGRYLSFAAWSPVLLLPWCLWGLLLGWNPLSPVLCNLISMMISSAGFAVLARPGKRQAAVILLLTGLFTPFTRFTLSAMPEAFCFCLLYWYMGFLMKHHRLKSLGCLTWLFVVSGILTLMRPYFFMFMLYPAWELWQWKGSNEGIPKKKQVWMRICAVFVPLFTFSLYALLKYCFSADYLHDLFDVSFLSLFRSEGMGAGFYHIFTMIAEGLRTIFAEYARLAVKHGHFAGSLYLAFGFLGFLVLLLTFWEGKQAWKNKKSESSEKSPSLFSLSLFLLFTMAGMLCAIFLMYKVGEGSRHLCCFLLIGFLLLGMYLPRRGLFLQAAMAGVICYFFIFKAWAPYDYQLSFDNGVLRQELSVMEEALDVKMVLEKEMGWDNTVIWLAYDLVEGEIVSEEWQQLYALPPGFGINYCSRDYVYDRLEEVQSRYIAAITGGDVEKQLIEYGAVFLSGNNKIAVYDLRAGVQ